MALKIKHVSDNGDIVEFLPSRPILLSYTDLMEAKSTGRCNLKFKIKAGEATRNKCILEDYETISMHTTPDKEHTVFALAIDGWLPLPFTGKSIIIADRNIIDGIQKMQINNKKDDYQSMEWWMNISKYSDITINTMLYAYEGDHRKFPSFEEFCISFNEAVDIVKSYNMKAIEYKADDYKAAYDIVEKLKPEIEKEIDFLLTVAPMVVNQHNDKVTQEIQAKIDDIVNESHLSTTSLAYILVLGCLYENKGSLGRLHARKVLKPKLNYTREQAYNTIMDLLHLKMLLLSCKLPNKDKTFFCTADFHLASFWIGLDIHNLTVEENSIRFSSYIDNILPRLDNSIIDNGELSE